MRLVQLNQSLHDTLQPPRPAPRLRLLVFSSAFFLLPPPFTSYTFHQETEAYFLTAFTLETERYARDQNLTLIHRSTSERAQI